jgi:hypothetical protein
MIEQAEQVRSREQCGRVAVDRYGRLAGWRAEAATERNGFPVGGEVGIESRCTSADREFVSYGANVEWEDFAVQSIFGEALFPPLIATVIAPHQNPYSALYVFSTRGSPMPPI